MDQTSVPWHFLNHSMHLNFLFGKWIFSIKTKNLPPATTTYPSVRLKKWYVHFANAFFQWSIFGRVNFFGRLSSHVPKSHFKTHKHVGRLHLWPKSKILSTRDHIKNLLNEIFFCWIILMCSFQFHISVSETHVFAFGRI